MCVVHWNPGPGCMEREKVKENAGPSARVNEWRAAMLALEELGVWGRGTARPGTITAGTRPPGLPSATLSSQTSSSTWDN